MPEPAPGGKVADSKAGGVDTLIVGLAGIMAAVIGAIAAGILGLLVQSNDYYDPAGRLVDSAESKAPFWPQYLGDLAGGAGGGLAGAVVGAVVAGFAGSRAGGICGSAVGFVAGSLLAWRLTTGLGIEIGLVHAAVGGLAAALGGAVGVMGGKDVPAPSPESPTESLGTLGDPGH